MLRKPTVKRHHCCVDSSLARAPPSVKVISELCWRCGERAAVGSFGRGCPNSSVSAFFACENKKEGEGGKGLGRREEAVGEMVGRDEALHSYIPPHLHDGV